MNEVFFLVQGENVFTLKVFLIYFSMKELYCENKNSIDYLFIHLI